MIRAMAKQYKEGKTRCYKLTNGKKICASEKAWGVFFGKVTSDYGKGAETKPRTRSVNESDINDTEEAELSEFEEDTLIDWYLEKIRKEDK